MGEPKFDPAFQPAEQEFDPAFTPFDPSFEAYKEPETGGHWETRGPHQMWIPDVKPVDTRGSKYIDPTPALNKLEQGMQNMRESSLGRAHPILADWATWITGGVDKSIIEGLAEPDTLATGLAGMLRPKPSMIPKVSPIQAMEKFKYEPSMGVRLQYPESAVEANSVSIGTDTLTNRSIGSPPGAGETRLGFDPYVETVPTTQRTMIDPRSMRGVAADYAKHRKLGKTVEEIEEEGLIPSTRLREARPGEKLGKGEKVRVSTIEGEPLPYPLNVVPQAVQPRSAQAVTEALTPTSLVEGATPTTNMPGNVLKTPMKMVRGGFQVKPDGTFVDDFGNVIQPEAFRPIPAAEALKAGKPGEKISWLREAYELGRGTSAAGDASAPFRQGLGRIGSREWFRAWVPMFKSFGNEKAYEAVNKSIAELPHIKSGLAERAGLVLTDINDISRAEEVIRSRLAEKLPFYIGKFIRSTNRGYTAYLNHLRANTFDRWAREAIDAGLDPNRDFQVFRNIADAVGDLTGRGRLKFDVGMKGSVNVLGKNIRLGRTVNLEQHADLASKIFFAPKLMASRIRTLNPSTYIMTDPFTRRKELGGLLRMGAWWLGTAGMARYIRGDESVSTDPNSADFGKVKEGNVRADVAGGYQQYLVLASRMVSGKYTSSATEKETEFGSRYGADVRTDAATRFIINKLHPTLKFAWDLGSATQKRPMHLGDRVAQMYMPMLASDLVKIYQEDPTLLPWMGPAAAVGMGTQVYEKNEPESGTYVDPENDITWEGGGFLPE